VAAGVLDLTRLGTERVCPLATARPVGELVPRERSPRACEVDASLARAWIAATRAARVLARPQTVSVVRRPDVHLVLLQGKAQCVDQFWAPLVCFLL
jgi:hypothetical protein